jgi:hypothetical protein
MSKSPSIIPLKSRRPVRSPLLAFSVIAALGLGVIVTSGAFETNETENVQAGVSAQPTAEIEKTNLQQQASPGVAPQDPAEGMAPAQDYGDPQDYGDQGTDAPVGDDPMGDSSMGDPMGGDPAFDQPAFDDPAFDDPEFEDPAFDDPTWDTGGDYYDQGVQDPAFSDPYQPPAADPTFQDPAFQDPNLGDPNLGDQGLIAPTASPTPVPDGQVIEGQPQDLPAAQPDLQTQPGEIPPGEPIPPGADVPENPGVHQDPAAEFPQGEMQTEPEAEQEGM